MKERKRWGDGPSRGGVDGSNKMKMGKALGVFAIKNGGRDEEGEQ